MYAVFSVKTISYLIFLRGLSTHSDWSNQQSLMALALVTALHHAFKSIYESKRMTIMVLLATMLVTM